jgi:penicillin-binding protein 1A
VKLSIFVGDGNPKLGRTRIVKLARDMGITTPLPDTPSLPIGADAVTMIEHVGAYGTFPNLGMKVTQHAILEVRTGDGRTIWRFDRDGPKTKRVMSQRVAQDMITMMNNVVEHGTAQRARLDGIIAAGKTGTTNAYRDAWFMGYTGNFVCGVWFGNDNYEPLNRMTGGSLPAMTWHAIMEYAHQGIEIRQLPGLPVPAVRPKLVADAKPNVNAPPPRPRLLSKRGSDVLVRIERLMDDAAKALGPLPTVAEEGKRQAKAPSGEDSLTAALEGRAFVRN